MTQRRLPRYPVPVALIGRLAVDLRARGKRVEESLLLDALRRVAEAADILGCAGVIVDAKDPDAEAFYRRYEFVTVEAAAWPHRMFLAIQTIRATFED